MFAKLVHGEPVDQESPHWQHLAGTGLLLATGAVVFLVFRLITGLRTSGQLLSLRQHSTPFSECLELLCSCGGTSMMLKNLWKQDLECLLYIP
jgi:hypothetical protein